MHYAPCVQQFMSFHEARNTPGPWDKAANDNAPWLFGTYRGRRVRVATATRTGRVGITNDVLQRTFTPEKMVRLSDLRDLAPAIYPPRVEPSPAAAPPAVVQVANAPASRFASDIMDWAARLAGVTIADLMETSMKQQIVRARMVAYGMLYGQRRRSLPQIGALMRKDHTTVLHALRKVGLMHHDVSAEDRSWLGRIWENCGHAADEVPCGALGRLEPFIVIDGGKVEPAARHALMAAREQENRACAA